jgi:small subunit ribosomal protein S19
MNRSIWKPHYISLNLYKDKDYFLTKNIKENVKLVSRNDIILEPFINKNFRIHNGNNYKVIIVKSNMVGHKFGEFFMTRKRAVFKPKLKVKKKR